jgi:hypothetical protein
MTKQYKQDSECKWQNAEISIATVENVAYIYILYIILKINTAYNIKIYNTRTLQM